jgi:two-component system cell cycle sensor histidine kinase/response regulator CckA
MRIYLPRWEEPVGIPSVPPPAPAAPAAPAPAPAPAPSSARVVLLVEDEDAVRRLAERTLARHGWTVLAAECGEDALARLGASPPALAAIVTDMVMPGMDGGALVRAVRQRLAAPGLPAILVSGYAEETLRRELDTTATLFLPKPYSLKELVARLAELTRAPEPEAARDLTGSLREPD